MGAGELPAHADVVQPGVVAQGDRPAAIDDVAPLAQDTGTEPRDRRPCTLVTDALHTPARATTIAPTASLPRSRYFHYHLAAVQVNETRCRSGNDRCVMAWTAVRLSAFGLDHDRVVAGAGIRVIEE